MRNPVTLAPARVTLGHMRGWDDDMTDWALRRRPWQPPDYLRGALSDRERTAIEADVAAARRWLQDNGTPPWMPVEVFRCVALHPGALLEELDRIDRVARERRWWA